MRHSDAFLSDDVATEFLLKIESKFVRKMWLILAWRRRSVLVKFAIAKYLFVSLTQADKFPARIVDIEGCLF